MGKIIHQLLVHKHLFDYYLLNYNRKKWIYPIFLLVQQPDKSVNLNFFSFKIRNITKF